MKEKKIDAKSRLDTSVGLGVGDARAALDIGLRNTRNISLDSVVAESREVVGGVRVLVDGANHALRAVFALAAVEPDGLLILNNDLENLLTLALVDGEEAGEEGVSVAGDAGLVEGGLDDGVVEGQVVVLDDVADLSEDVVGIEVETRAADGDGVGHAGELRAGDDVVGGLCGGCRAESGDGSEDDEELGEHCGCV